MILNLAMTNPPALGTSGRVASRRGRTIARHSRDRGQDADVRGELAQLAHLIGARTRAEPQVDAGQIG